MSPAVADPKYHFNESKQTPTMNTLHCTVAAARASITRLSKNPCKRCSGKLPASYKCVSNSHTEIPSGEFSAVPSHRKNLLKYNGRLMAPIRCSKLVIFAPCATTLARITHVKLVENSMCSSIATRRNTPRRHRKFNLHNPARRLPN